MQQSILDAIELRPLLWDGAMGTQLYDRGIFLNQGFEELCLRNPDIVRKVHVDYIDAGADVIETNTFGANRLRLRRAGSQAGVGELNEAAVRIAREAAGRRIYVAGAIGPSGRTPSVSSDSELVKIRGAFEEQAAALAGSGVDLIVLETFRLLSEIRLALEGVRAVSGVPVVAQMAFDDGGLTGDGAEPERVADLLAEWGADVVGCNCMEGPQASFDVASRMVGRGKPVSVQPNAGYPQKVDERLLYMATPEYFSEYVRRCLKIGVEMVGGCCGTSPAHIREAHGALRMMAGGRPSVTFASSPPVEDDAPPVSVVPVWERSAFAAKIERAQRDRVLGPEPDAVTPENFCVSVELASPVGVDMTKALSAAEMLRSAGVDVVNIADGPRATVRVSNMVLAELVQRDVGLETITHVCGRDRNLLRLQSDLLGSHLMGLRNLVCITGDPPKAGDYPNATAVYDVDAIGLLKLASALNRGRDPAGRAIGEPTAFFLACGAEPAALDRDRELRRLEEKKAAGANFVMTQPVYEPDVLHRFLDDIAHLELPVLVGLLPLASHKNALFLHNEVPGMRVPEAILDRMEKVPPGPPARAEGVCIAREALREVRSRVVGAYLMPPLGRYRAALEVLEAAGYSSPGEEEAGS